MAAIIAQVLPFLSQEHQQQVATAVERAKQVTMSDLNAVVAGGVSVCLRTSFSTQSGGRDKIHELICEMGGGGVAVLQ